MQAVRFFPMSEQTFYTQWNNPTDTIVILHSPISISVIVAAEEIQGDSFGTRPKKMRLSQRLFIRF